MKTLVYCDLDGKFLASPDYQSPGGHSFSFDKHEGSVDWEIVIGVLPVYEGDLALTVEAINRYFARNHDYRTGQLSFPPVYLGVTELNSAATPNQHDSLMNSIRNGPSAWTPYSASSNALIYFDSPSMGMSVDQGYAALTKGLAEIAVLSAHGLPSTHGQLTLAWVSSHSIKTALLWSDACSVGNLDYTTNWLTEVLYNPNSQVIAARGTTGNSGGMGNSEEGFYGHNIAARLASGESLAEALLGHVNVPLIPPWSEHREFYFMLNVVLGDPTVSLSP